MSSVDQQSPRVSRRNLALGAAWAAPVIALGAPAPAQAVTNSACDPATGTFNFSWDIFNSATAPSDPTVGASTSVSVTSQGFDSLQNNSNPTALSGRTINRLGVNAVPLGLMACTQPDFNLSVTTTRYGHAFDSYTCVPGFAYPASQTCGNPGAGGYAPQSLTKSQWRDGANLSPVSGYDTPGQLPAPGVAGTAFGLSLGWNNYAPGGTGAYTGTSSVGYLNRSEWTFTFSQAVTDLYFNLYDIDYRNSLASGGGSGTGAREYVAFSSSAGTLPTSFGTRGASVAGSGTIATPWVSTLNGDASRNAAASGITNIYFSTVTTFTIVAWSEDTTYRTSENIFMSDLKFKCPTGC
ncbi:MAG: hypothetical protein KBB39_02555 [Phycicoccus sp.]|nr:hypothetical protein [Phycicoccus sp.]